MHYTFFMSVNSAVNLCTYTHEYHESISPERQLLAIYQHTTVQGDCVWREQQEPGSGVMKLQWIMSGLGPNSSHTS